ncbi:CopG family transcriptional regulator [Ureibacillus manganicus]|uniref:CopG family transcriptional regulator n=1 Tax=Ureibacillus manganicus DSM 26584 TaxID=1384049 RepID=A0A0A3HTB4_9BACL|nr:CopG family transcriptional regulator [Ureibacillus manganicus]KGR73533.1 CopG family transcriptional regulator [Ureibacillus manganicus DSM 26584]
MAETEKITINMNVVDLGKVDLLVEQGFYSNRTDFIKTAIRSQLTTYSNVVEPLIKEKSFAVGISYFNKSLLEEVHSQNKQLDIKVVGMLVLADDIEEELAIKTINSVKVFGVLKASPEIKEVINHINHEKLMVR